jgi:hypothetical protein
MHRAVETGILDALDPEQERRVQTVLDTIQPMLARAVGGIEKEVRLDIKLSARQSIFGTTDLRLLGMDGDPTKETIIDYKFGRLPVPPAAENRQAWAYACGVFQAADHVTEVTCVFIQPRLEVVDVVKFNRAVDYPRLLESLASLVKECKKKNPTRTPCKACEYCARLDTCPAVASTVAQTVDHSGRLFVDSTPCIEDTTAKQLDESLLPLARVAEAWAKSVKERAKRILMSGELMEHHEIAERTASRKFSAPTATIVGELRMRSVNIDTILPACALSFSQLKTSMKRDGHRPELFTNIATELTAAGLLEPENQRQQYLKRK